MPRKWIRREDVDRELYREWTAGFTICDNGGVLYLWDGRVLERWPGESAAHAVRRNGADWRPVVIKCPR